MEKFSAYRDPGTGIQPFLTPVPPVGSGVLVKVALPFGFVLGMIRTILVVLLCLLYLVLQCICFVLWPIPPLYRMVMHFFTFLIGRLVLFIIGLVWIPVDQVSRKRGKGKLVSRSWNPRAGDLIISNWVSWIEILWLAIRFNPIFILPVFGPTAVPPIVPTPDPIMHSPGRRTGTGSANVILTTRTSTVRTQFRGFRRISLLTLLRLTGRVPPFGLPDPGSPLQTFEQIQNSADRPVAVFPESTTSNGRGLLRFANIFPGQPVPAKRFGVYIMCVRYDPPTNFAPSPIHSIPSTSFNPLPHLFSLTTSLIPLKISIRVLEPSESPGSQLFLVSEVVPNASNEDVFVETCATLIAQLGKLKRTRMGWEDKATFLDFYRGKKM